MAALSSGNGQKSSLYWVNYTLGSIDLHVKNYTKVYASNGGTMLYVQTHMIRY